MTPVRLEPTALRSRVKHSTTEPLRSPVQTTEDRFSRDEAHIITMSISLRGCDITTGVRVIMLDHLCIITVYMIQLYCYRLDRIER